MIALIWYYYGTDEFNNANDDVIDYPRNYSIIKNFEKITSNVMDMPSTDKFLKIPSFETFVYQDIVLSKLQTLLIEKTKTNSKSVMEYFSKNVSVTYAALFGTKNSDGVSFLNQRLNRWIVFPWEREIGGL